MFILTNNKVAFVQGEVIEKGRWKNDLSMDTYRIKNGDNYQYAVIADFELHEVDSVPEDFKPNKYCYTEKEGFYENPTWTEPNEYNIPDEVYNKIIDDYTLSLIEEKVL